MPSMMRRMRTRLPTYLSTGLGALVDIINTPWHDACRLKQKRSRTLLRRQCRQILLGNSVGNECRKFEQGPDGSALEGFAGQNANCTVGLSTGGFRMRATFCDHVKTRVNKGHKVHFATRRRTTKSKATVTIMAAGMSPVRA